MQLQLLASLNQGVPTLPGNWLPSTHTHTQRNWACSATSSDCTLLTLSSGTHPDAGYRSTDSCVLHSCPLNSRNVAPTLPPSCPNTLFDSTYLCQQLFCVEDEPDGIQKLWVRFQLSPVTGQCVSNLPPVLWDAVWMCACLWRWSSERGFSVKHCELSVRLQNR